MDRFWRALGAGLGGLWQRCFCPARAPGGAVPRRAWRGRACGHGQIGAMHAESGHVAQKRRITFEPSPEINVEGFNIFFRLSARSSNTHQRGLIWSAILTTLNFREKTRLQSGDTLFYLLEKTSKSCIFTHGAPPCSEQSCNKAMFSRHPRATRGIASRISPPFPPKSMLSSAAAAPSRPSNIDLGGRGAKRNGEATEMPTALQ